MNNPILVAVPLPLDDLKLAIIWAERTNYTVPGLIASLAHDALMAAQMQDMKVKAGYGASGASVPSTSSDESPSNPPPEKRPT